MATWNDFAQAEPEFASLIKARFDAHKHKMMATLRKDGSPRISGIETTFANGQLWLSMMPDSVKALDLQRDPRLALHSVSLDSEMADGDAKISGRAIKHSDETTMTAFADAVKDASGQDMSPGLFHVFAVEIQEAVLIRVEGDHLVIETWREGRGLSRTERR